jgi:DNA repair protein RadC
LLRIKDIPVLDRPVERLVHNGVSNLSNIELLAILLKTGTKNKSAKELATEVLKKIGSINAFEEVTLEMLKSIKGIGTSKAAIIISALELGKRVRLKPLVNSNYIDNCTAIYDYYKEKIGFSYQEQFWCLYLDTSKKIIADELLFVGTINKSLVHPREIFKNAYLKNASSIVCIHNHPAGTPYPSKEDYELTKRLKEIGLTLGIPLIDHLIITRDKYYSFFENDEI